MLHSLLIRFYTIPDIAKKELNPIQFKMYQVKTSIILSKLKAGFPDAVDTKDGFKVVSEPDSFEKIEKEVERMKAALFDNKIDRATKNILSDSFFNRLKGSFARMNLRIYSKIIKDGCMIQYLARCGIMFFWETIPIKRLHEIN